MQKETDGKRAKTKPRVRHRITESQNGLEKTLKNISFQTPSHGQRHFSLDEVAQSLLKSC